MTKQTTKFYTGKTRDSHSVWNSGISLPYSVTTAAVNNGDSYTPLYLALGMGATNLHIFQRRMRETPNRALQMGIDTLMSCLITEMTTSMPLFQDQTMPTFFDKQPERAYAAVSLAFPLLICQHLATHPCLSLQESVLSLSRTEVGYVGITYSFISGKMKTVSDLIGSIPAISGCSFPIDVAA